MFAFTSPGMKFDNKFNKKGRGPPVLRLQGQPVHRMGSLLPKDGETPKFAQLYIYDTGNEVDHRIKSCGYVITKKNICISVWNHVSTNFHISKINSSYAVMAAAFIIHMSFLFNIMSWLLHFHIIKN
jgi:hypothetical protein